MYYKLRVLYVFCPEKYAYYALYILFYSTIIFRFRLYILYTRDCARILLCIDIFVSIQKKKRKTFIFFTITSTESIRFTSIIYVCVCVYVYKVYTEMAFLHIFRCYMCLLVVCELIYCVSSMEKYQNTLRRNIT